MIANLVFVDVKPEFVEQFRAISIYNHDNTRKEAGNIRFDVLRNKEDPNKFVLYEIWESEEALARHKTTEHYLRWRAEVADYMASPRHATATTPIAFD